MKLGDMPAFPKESSGTPGTMNWNQGASGMTLRQHYAGLLMAARITEFGYIEGDRVVFAELAVKDADALLAELEK